MATDIAYCLVDWLHIRFTVIKIPLIQRSQCFAEMLADLLGVIPRATQSKNLERTGDMSDSRECFVDESLCFRSGHGDGMIVLRNP
jgi:hypothetical protein